MEIEKVGYSGGFYFKATLDMVINKEIGQMLLGCQLKIKAFHLELFPAKF